MLHAERGEALEVVGGCKQREVVADAENTSHARPSPTVSAKHQVSELAFDLGSGRSVVRLPGGGALASGVHRGGAKEDTLSDAQSRLVRPIDRGLVQGRCGSH